MLVKLDSGDYINTNFIEFIGQSGFDWYAGMNHGEAQDLTEDDKDRIIKVMDMAVEVTPPLTLQLHSKKGGDASVPTSTDGPE